VFLVNSRLSRFTAPPRGSAGKRRHRQGCPFSRSYGAKLPNSLAEGLPVTCGEISAPTSVGLRYGHHGAS
jgi:hypothetical protein